LEHNNRGFLNWNPTTDQQKWRAGAPTQSIFPRAFQAHQEDDISLWVEKGQVHLTHPIAEPFAESKLSRPAMWITQSVRRMMHKENFKHRCAISNAFAALEDNSFSNHMFAWATSRYEDRLIRFTLKARLDALPSPQKINFWSKGKAQSRCPFCGEIGATLKHILCSCDKRGKNSLVMKRHNRVGCIVGQAARCGHKRTNMQINEDKRIEQVCKLHDDATQKAMRPDLVWEATNEDGKNCWQLTEITCPWSWMDHDGETLQKAYDKKVGKYDQLRREIAEAYPGRPVNQYTIVVVPRERS
jgi:hypothetical protein